jgi:hypothetical protein
VGWSLSALSDLVEEFVMIEGLIDKEISRFMGL